MQRFLRKVSEALLMKAFLRFPCLRDCMSETVCERLYKGYHAIQSGRQTRAAFTVPNINPVFFFSSK